MSGLAPSLVTFSSRSNQRPNQERRGQRQEDGADRPIEKDVEAAARDQQRLAQRRFHDRPEYHGEDKRRAFEAESPQEESRDAEGQHDDDLGGVRIEAVYAD